MFTKITFKDCYIVSSKPFWGTLTRYLGYPSWYFSHIKAGTDTQHRRTIAFYTITICIERAFTGLTILLNSTSFFTLISGGQYIMSASLIQKGITYCNHHMYYIHTVIYENRIKTATDR